MPIKGKAFASRVLLLPQWRGLRGEELNKATGMSDCEFIHHGGFIGGAWSLETCIKLAEQSMEVYREEEAKVAE